MRAILKPSLNPQAVYTTCIDSISDSELRIRLNLITNSLMITATDYEQKADNSQLYTLSPNTCRNSDIVLGSVTKKELKEIYNAHMVPREKPARLYYDSLLFNAPLGHCPYCGYGHASTLDHYLPKTKFPQFSVLPLNLVPACKDCNTGKSSAIVTTIDDQDLHPYFDHQHFITEQWLYANVVQTSPVSICFFVNPPDHWDDISKNRVRAHFKHFNLASRYAVESSSQLASLKGILARYTRQVGQESVRQHLIIEAESSFEQHVNSWQTAMYQALAASEWYCNGGFQ